MGLYNRVDAKRKWALTTEKKIRETTLTHIMPYLGKKHMSITINDSIKKLMSRDMAYTIIKIKDREVEKASIKF